MDLERYSKNISNYIAGSYITSAITLGNELGLFEELKRLEKPVSSQRLADACNLKERYVREWLGCMVSSNIVTMDDSDNYFVPESLKAGLQETKSAFFFPVLATLTSRAKKCFMKDGPQGYGEAFPDVVDVMDERMSSNADMVVEQLLLPVKKIKKSLKTILDLGSGAGCISRAISRRYPDADIYGVDYSEIAIAKAIEISTVQGIKNINFLKENATSLPIEWTGKFDWVIIYDVLHDLPDHINAMREVMRILKNDGVVSLTDPNLHSEHRNNRGNPNVAGVGYAISSVICLPCSLSIDGASGNGAGWGIENKETFLISSGWKVKDKRNVDSRKAFNFTCVKA